MNQQSINFAIGKKYTEFSVAIKSELMGKLSNHPDCVAYTDEIDKIHQMKATFAGINQVDQADQEV